MPSAGVELNMGGVVSAGALTEKPATTTAKSPATSNTASTVCTRPDA